MTVVEMKDTTRTTAHSASCNDVCIASDLDNKKDMGWGVNDWLLTPSLTNHGGYMKAKDILTEHRKHTHIHTHARARTHVRTHTNKKYSIHNKNNKTI